MQARAVTVPRLEPVHLLTLFLACLVLFPARLVVTPLGGIGQPALLVGLVLTGWWVATRMLRDQHLDAEPQPVRYAALALGWWITLGLAVAHLGPLTELERNEGGRTLIVLAAMTGVLLLTADGVSDRERLETLIRRVVLAGGFVATIGWIQFFTGVDAARWFDLPGLSRAVEFSSVQSRSIFNRPAGTATHPIEFGVVLGAILPLAIHRLMVAPADRRTRPRIMVLLIGPAVAMSVSRSGVVSLLVGVLVLASAWDWRRRLNVAAAGIAATAAMWALIPGLIGTMKGLFLNYEDDPSVQGRLDDVPLVAERVWDSPVFGSGTGTFSHQTDFAVDNQFFETAMENGLVGVIVMMLLVLAGYAVAWKTGRRAANHEDRHLGYALAGSILALAVSAYTFSAFFYRIYLGLLFLLLGCAGALWRITVRDAETAFDLRRPGSHPVAGASGGPPGDEQGELAATTWSARFLHRGEQVRDQTELDPELPA